MQAETWKEVEGYDGKYMVSDLGRVARIIGSNASSDEYESVQLMKGGQRDKKIAIRRLVAQAFLPNPDNLFFVRNIDGNMYNNQVDNVEYYKRAYTGSRKADE